MLDALLRGIMNKIKLTIELTPDQIKLLKHLIRKEFDTLSDYDDGDELIKLSESLKLYELVGEMMEDRTIQMFNHIKSSL